MLLSLHAREPCYHGCKSLQALLENAEIGDAVALPAAYELFADLVHRADQQVWCLQNLVSTHVEACRQGPFA